MDFLLVVLRLIHIVSAFAWVGLAVTMTFYVAPAAAAAGESGLRFLKALLTRTSFATAVGAAAGITTLAGILLYLVGNATAHFSSTGNTVLGIGALSGILATIHGGAVTGRATREFGEALVKHVPDNGQPIPADALPVLREHGMKVGAHSRLSLILVAIALLGMGSARYL
jgi:uncharacterized membrane protein